MEEVQQEYNYDQNPGKHCRAYKNVIINAVVAKPRMSYNTAAVGQAGEGNYESKLTKIINE